MTKEILGENIFELVTKPVIANCKARTFNLDPYAAHCIDVYKRA